MAQTLEEWAQLILDDFEVWTGWPLARAWQKARGSLPRGSRLIPCTPFVAGGAYELGNLRRCAQVESMKTRGPIACALVGLPEGG